MRVVDLMMSMAEGVGVEPMKEPEGDGGDGGNSNAPRKKWKLASFAAVVSHNKKPNEAIKRLLASGVFHGSSSRKMDKNKRPAVLTMREVCQQEFDRFQQRYEGACVDDYPVGGLLKSCVKAGRSLYPNMRALLEFCCPCQRLLPSLSGISAPLSVSSL